MTFSLPPTLVPEDCQWSPAAPLNPRLVMSHRLPEALQPFLTWLTAQPVPGQPIQERSPLSFIAVASMQTILGALATVVAIQVAPALAPLGMLLTTAGLGLFQVVIFHHCSHGTVFRSRELNVRIGRIISAILLFKHFDHYKHEHMLHHSHNKLLTEEDEFADFVFNTCRLDAGVAHAELRRRVLWGLVSPAFHARFTVRRVKVAWFSHDRQHNAIGIAAWAALALLAGYTGHWLAFLLAWVVPVTIFLQAATVGRILCEHSFPEVEIIAARSRDLTAHATSGVFPGRHASARPSHLAARLAELGGLVVQHAYDPAFRSSRRAGRRCALPRLSSPQARQQALDQLHPGARPRQGGPANADTDRL